LLGELAKLRDEGVTEAVLSDDDRGIDRMLELC
jgi:hypothetical protein